jgi:hypothetical protein
MEDPILQTPVKIKNACLLCSYTGSDHDVFDEITSYVADNSHRVHLNEIASQVQVALKARLDISLSHSQVRTHFLHHQCDQKLVLNTVLRDFVDIVSVGKNHCIYTDDDGITSIDTKNTGVYIDSVKQLMSIYKQLDSLGRAKQ